MKDTPNQDEKQRMDLVEKLQGEIDACLEFHHGNPPEGSGWAVSLDLLEQVKEVIAYSLYVDGWYDYAPY